MVTSSSPLHLSAPQTASDPGEEKKKKNTKPLTHCCFLPAGVFCGRVWDGLLCWDETPAGTTVTQSCPGRPELEAATAGERVQPTCEEGERERENTETMTRSEVKGHKPK